MRSRLKSMIFDPLDGSLGRERRANRVDPVSGGQNIRRTESERTGNRCYRYSGSSTRWNSRVWSVCRNGRFGGLHALASVRIGPSHRPQ